ncbi:MAG: sortase, partial [Lachnospiraceae bacterium]|nr:sortase [Lachnospiraceae bacterium]
QPAAQAEAHSARPSAARPLNREEQALLAAWMQGRGMDTKIFTPVRPEDVPEEPDETTPEMYAPQQQPQPVSDETQIFTPVRTDARPQQPQTAAQPRPQHPQQQQMLPQQRQPQPQQPPRQRQAVSDDTRVFTPPQRYPERRQRVPSEADVEWRSRRKMRGGETPAQKAYRAAMEVPGADEALKKVQAPARPMPGQAPAQLMQTQQLPPLRPKMPGTKEVVTPEPPRPAEVTAPLPKEIPLLPEESPLSDSAPEAAAAPVVQTTAAPTEKASDILARSIETTPVVLQTPAQAEQIPVQPDAALPQPSPAAKKKSGKTKAEKAGTPRRRRDKKRKKQQEQPPEENTVITDLQNEIPVREGRSTTRPEAYREEREKRRKKEERLTFIIAACVILFLVAGFFLLRIYLNYRRSADEYAELSETYVSMPHTDTEAEAEEATASADDYPQLQIDFPSLFALNEDLVAWIYVPGCGISYPVVRGEDNEYYLSHTFLGSDSSSGAIFMDAQDAAGFIDFNTFLYGHNLKDGTMFTALSNYRTNPDLIREYPYFYIYRSNGSVRKYRICAFYNDEGYSDSYFRVTTPEDKAAYVAMINTKSVMTQGLPLGEGEHEVTSDDLLVTLSTCQDSVRSGRRFLVHGYLVETYLENSR